MYTVLIRNITFDKRCYTLFNISSLNKLFPLTAFRSSKRLIWHFKFTCQKQLSRVKTSALLSAALRRKKTQLIRAMIFLVLSRIEMQISHQNARKTKSAKRKSQILGCFHEFLKWMVLHLWWNWNKILWKQCGYELEYQLEKYKGK